MVFDETRFTMQPEKSYFYCEYEINLVEYHYAKDRYWHLTFFLNEKLVTYL